MKNKTFPMTAVYK